MQRESEGEAAKVEMMEANENLIEEMASEERKVVEKLGRKFDGRIFGGVNNDRTAHWSMMKNFEMIEPRVTLLCEPKFGWVECVNTVLLIERHSSRKMIAASYELNFKVRTTCLHSSRPIQVQCTFGKFESCPFARLL